MHVANSYSPFPLCICQTPTGLMVTCLIHIFCFLIAIQIIIWWLIKTFFKPPLTTFHRTKIFASLCLSLTHYLIPAVSAGVAAGGGKRRGQDILRLRWRGGGGGGGERKEGRGSCYGKEEALRDGSRPPVASEEHQATPAEPQCSCESTRLLINTHTPFISNAWRISLTLLLRPLPWERP